MDTDRFPTATWKLSEPVDISSVPESGEPRGVEATGEMTIKGVSKTVTTWESDRTRSVVVSGESSRSRSDLTSLSESAAWLDSGSIEFYHTYLRTYTYLTTPTLQASDAAINSVHWIAAGSLLTRNPSSMRF